MFLFSAATQFLGLQSSLPRVLWLQKVDVILQNLNLWRSFSLVPSTYGQFILILISFSWISVAYVCCCDWDRLWLLVTLLKILLIMLSRYPFLFSTCFIIPLSWVKSFLLMIMEHALINKEEKIISFQFIRWWELCVGIGQYL